MGNSCKVIFIGIVVVALVLMTIILLATSLKKLSSKEMGLQYDVVQKELSDKVYTEGLHTGPPGYEFIIFPNIFKSVAFKDEDCLTREGVKIHMDITFQFRVKMSKMRKNTMLFKEFDQYHDLLIREGLSGFYESCSLFNLTQFQSERGVFESEINRIISERYEKVGCDVAGMQVNNIDWPSLYTNAVKSKESAKEDIGVAEQEGPRKETAARTLKDEADLEAGIILDKAESDARILRQLAQKKAEAIHSQYEKESEAYEAIIGKSGLEFSPEALISYMGVRVISEAKNPVYIGLDGPAKTSFVKP